MPPWEYRDRKSTLSKIKSKRETSSTPAQAGTGGFWWLALIAALARPTIIWPTNPEQCNALMQATYRLYTQKHYFKTCAEQISLGYLSFGAILKYLKKQINGKNRGN